MTFLIRPGRLQDGKSLGGLSKALTSHGFLTLPVDGPGIERLVRRSTDSFAGRPEDPDQAVYLFVLEKDGLVAGLSLIITRHGSPESPHLYFAVDPARQTIRFREETTGRTELGGLYLDASLRRHPERLGRRLSLVRLLYIGRHRDRFCDRILAELLPPFGADGRSPFWEALGRKWTGMSYRDAGERARRDKDFVTRSFPKEEIAIKSLPSEAREVLGRHGPETVPAARLLEAVGFRYLNEVDPFDGGPHYGAGCDEIPYDKIEGFFRQESSVRVEVPGL